VISYFAESCGYGDHLVGSDLRRIYKRAVSSSEECRRTVDRGGSGNVLKSEPVEAHWSHSEWNSIYSEMSGP
jgi:hypothetical protein